MPLLLTQQGKFTLSSTKPRMDLKHVFQITVFTFLLENNFAKEFPDLSSV
jgi:hypothetical protein